MRGSGDSMALRGAYAPAPEVEERSDEAPGAGAAPAGRVPDPEVVAKPKRRQFSAEYRLRFLEEADRCTRPGESSVFSRAYRAAACATFAGSVAPPRP